VDLSTPKVQIDAGKNASDPNYSVHAEVDAFRRFFKNYTRVFGFRRRGARRIVDLTVVRYNKSGLYVNSAPCFHCVKDIKSFEQHGFKINVYYSNADGQIVKMDNNLEGKKSSGRRQRN